MWQRGDHAGAIAQMREIVTADPDYFWGWQQLANWFDEEESTADYLQATEHLVRLGPNDPSAFGYRGEARAAAGDRRGAKGDFRRAFELDPAYAFAGISLFDSLLADDELDEAERTVARLEEHVGGPHVQLRSLRLKCLRKDREGAAAVFRSLIAQSDVPPFVISKAAAAMEEAGFDAAVDTAVGEAVDGEPIQAVARLFVERAGARNDWSFLERLPQLLKRGEGGREVLYATIDALAGPAHRGRLHDLLGQYGDEIRQSHRGWAKAIGSLVSVRDYETAVTWAGDWKERKPDEPWMLHPLSIALRQLGRFQEAYQVAVYVLGLEAEDTTTDDFRVWLAFEETLDGRADRAERTLGSVDEEELDDVPRILYKLAKSLIGVQRAGRSGFEVARSAGMQAVRELAPKDNDPDLFLSYQRWARRLAQAVGGVGPWLWSLLYGKKLPRK
jgi:tetratricopeptide (TPR) repeat protein